MQIRRKKSVDFFLGVLIPLPIFLDLSSPFLLANNRLAEGGVAFPLSMFFLPVGLLCFFKRFDWAISRKSVFVLISIFGFCLWSIVLGLLSISVSFDSIYYSIQWIIPFLWMPYFLVLFRLNKQKEFFEGFYYGVAVAITYIFISGILEILFYGGLMDAGRISQNKVLAGQYQLYIYTPTILAYGALIVNWLSRSGYLNISLVKLIVLNMLCITSLLFLAAREAIFVYLLGIIMYYSIGKIYRTIGLITLLSLFALLLIGLSDEISRYANIYEIRVLDKVLAMKEDGGLLGARDTMAKEYIRVIRNDYIFGSRMLPPEIIYPELGVKAPSAHNYYLDVWAWSGIIGAILVLISIFSALFKAFRIVFRSYLIRISAHVVDPDKILRIGISSCVVLFFCVSSVINVPMRQPLTGPIAALLMSFLIFGKKNA